jgi:succinylarginine dihydrolase
MVQFHEVNFDGLVGPTHNYAGLSYGNVASMRNRASVSSPRDAALQGLAKMKFLHDLGARQAVLPPHERPHIRTLRRLGFTGNDADILYKVHKEDPMVLAAVSSSSAMWTANAATVSPSADCADDRVHFTPANLLTQFHRSLEPQTTAAILKAIFTDEGHFAHHPPLPASNHFADEGAANHMRLSWRHDDGMELFIYGRRGFDPGHVVQCKFPARQTLEASEAIARLHAVSPDRAMFLRQNPAAIDAGAFHNDVVAVAHRDVLLAHASAYAEPGVIELLAALFEKESGTKLHALTIADDELPLADAVSSYLFNSQLVTVADGSIALVAPVEARDNERARVAIDHIIAADNPVRAVHYVDVRESMRNGGGPACLRIRVPLTDEQIAAANSAVFLTEPLYQALRAWVMRHYRETLFADDLADPKLLEEGRTALEELSRLLRLGSIYAF